MKTRFWDCPYLIKSGMEFTFFIYKIEMWNLDDLEGPFKGLKFYLVVLHRGIPSPLGRALGSLLAFTMQGLGKTNTLEKMGKACK